MWGLQEQHSQKNEDKDYSERRGHQDQAAGATFGYVLGGRLALAGFPSPIDLNANPDDYDRGNQS